MILKAITYNYTEGGVQENKVVGIFTSEQLDKAMQDLRTGFGRGKTIKKAEFDAVCNNYFLEFDDDEKSYFYTSNYTVGELKL